MSQQPMYQILVASDGTAHYVQVPAPAPRQFVTADPITGLLANAVKPTPRARQPKANPQNPPQPKPKQQPQPTVAALNKAKQQKQSALTQLNQAKQLLEVEKAKNEQTQRELALEKARNEQVAQKLALEKERNKSKAHDTVNKLAKAIEKASISTTKVAEINYNDHVGQLCRRLGMSQDTGNELRDKGFSRKADLDLLKPGDLRSLVSNMRDRLILREHLFE